MNKVDDDVGSIIYPMGVVAGIAVAAIAGCFAFSNPTSTAAWQDAPIASSARDAIPFRSVNGSMYVYANLGGIPHNMILDTGATVSCATVPIARTLIARGRADVVPGWFTSTIADGSVVPNQRIVVHTMTIGRHVLHNVEMSVGQDGAPVLLGLSELSAIGNFTVDQSRSQIRFD
jgi:predicted aspartyl protease